MTAAITRAGARALTLALLPALATLSPVRRAVAAPGVRPMFEPTDMEMDQPGDVEIDLQVGAIRSAGPWRAVMPDFEIDIGILPNLELDIDGGFAIEGPPEGPFRFDHASPDNLWLAAKVGLLDRRDGETAAAAEIAWALGIEVGPKLPVAPGTSGAGVEALALLAHHRRRTHLAFNLGAFVDPRVGVGSGGSGAGSRPAGIEVGLDLARDIGPSDRFTVTAELGAVHFLSGDPDQLMATAGLAFAPRDELALSLVGLGGLRGGGDRYGLLLGLSGTLRVFRARRQ